MQEELRKIVTKLLMPKAKVTTNDEKDAINADHTQKFLQYMLEQTPEYQEVIDKLTSELEPLITQAKKAGAEEERAKILSQIMAGVSNKRGE